MWKNIVNFFKAPVFLDDEEKTLRARVIHFLLINMGGVVAILGTLGILFVFAEKRVTSLILVITFLLVITEMAINRRGYVKASGILILSGLWGVTVLLIGCFGRHTQPGHYLLCIRNSHCRNHFRYKRHTVLCRIKFINQFGANSG